MGVPDIAFMQEHGITTIVFTKLDRAFRSVCDCVLTLDQWAAQGIAFHSGTGIACTMG